MGFWTDIFNKKEEEEKETTQESTQRSWLSSNTTTSTTSRMDFGKQQSIDIKAEEKFRIEPTGSSIIPQPEEIRGNLGLFQPMVDTVKSYVPQELEPSAKTAFFEESDKPTYSDLLSAQRTRIERENSIAMIEKYKSQFPKLKIDNLSLADTEIAYRAESMRVVYEAEKENLANVKLPEGYEEPEGYWGQLWEGTQESFWSTFVPNLGFLLESTSRQWGIPELAMKGQQMGFKATIEALKKPELQGIAFKEYIEIGKDSPIQALKMATGRATGGMVGYMAPSIITGLLANMLSGGTSTFATVTSVGTLMLQEKGNFYNELAEAGVAPLEAARWADVYSTISSFIEMSTGYTPLGITKWLTSGTKNLFKMSTKDMLKQLPKQVLKKLPKVGASAIIKSGWEGNEEVEQLFVSEAIKIWLDLPVTKDFLVRAGQDWVMAFLGSLSLGITEFNSQTEKPGLRGLTIEEVSPESEKTILDSIGKRNDSGDQITNIEKTASGKFKVTEHINATNKDMVFSFSPESAINLVRNIFTSLPSDAERKILMKDIKPVEKKVVEPLAKEAMKIGKPVFRGTMGLGEINKIPTEWQTMYQKDYGNLWADTIKDVDKYARGFSQVTSKGAVRRPIGNEPFIIEGREMPDGRVVPIKATNLDTKEVIDFTKPQAKATPEKVVAKKDELPELPKELAVKEIKKEPLTKEEEETEVVESIYEEQFKKEREKGGKKLLSDIKNLGGLKTEASISEEMSDLPIDIMRKDGFTPDEIASELNEIGGYDYKSGMDVVNAIKAVRTMPTRHRAAKSVVQKNVEALKKYNKILTKTASEKTKRRLLEQYARTLIKKATPKQKIISTKRIIM